MREVLHRPPLDKEKFESNWDAIFGKKPTLCTFCNAKHDPNEECDEKIKFRNDSEARYRENRKKTLGWVDNWTGD